LQWPLVQKKKQLKASSLNGVKKREAKLVIEIKFFLLLEKQQ